MFGEDRRGIQVTRQILYDQVWSTPMTKVAKEYGISDVALAKICKKLTVPYPGRGYWRRIETGKTVKQTALPPNQDPSKQQVTIHRTIRAEMTLSEDVVQRIAVEQVPGQTIEVPERLGKTHRLISGQLTNWRSASVDEYGAIQSGTLRQLNIRVSPQALSRALRIMNTLFCALETLGYPVGNQEGYRKTLGVRINDEPVEFGLEEKFQRIELPQDPKRRSSPWSYPRHEYRYVATGILTLKINEWVDGVQKSWSDGKTARLETTLNNFLVGLLKVAEALKARRLKQEEEARLRQEAQRRREEEAHRLQEEQRRRQALLNEAENWAKAQQLRSYLAAVKEAVVTQHGTIQAGSKADQWFSWAYQQADALDPLRPPKAT
ncbi:MAG: hypothetical protein K2X00_01755 [Nitrospiraceae bacterium]|nr:hypothetical protein [Nitrospiraceae bacterium]